MSKVFNSIVVSQEVKDKVDKEFEKKSMKIFNVLFKDLVGNTIPTSTVFSTLEKAEDFCIKFTKTNSLSIKSTLKTLDENSPIGDLTDYRCEDSEGKTYYLVIYVQKLN